jgi:acyl transferase domain-containing protein
VNGIRRASINNFGYGGANAHVVVEDYESFLSSTKHITNGSITKSLPENSNNSSSSNLFVLSAKDEQAALQMASDLKQHLENIQPADESRYLSNLAYTLGQRRTRFPWVASYPSRSLSDLIQALDSAKMKPAKAIEPPNIGFVFTGQGAQWWAMGRELIEAYPVYKESVLEAEGYLREFGCQWSLIGMVSNHIPQTCH